MVATGRLSESVCMQMRTAISSAYGNEVFFAGKINDDGLVVSVEVASRGNSESVPLQFELARQCDVLIHNHPSGHLVPSEADLAVASHAAECAQGFYIVNNDVSAIYVVVEPIKPVVLEKIDSENACLYLSAEGPLALKSQNYEERPSQLDLLAKICDVFNKDFVGIFEAGTGVGKSYAYLVPTILWTAANNERVVISTGTINLQQQLAEKDIPAALDLVGKNVKFLLLKGRQNYVCLRRLNNQLAEPDLFAEDNDVLDRISQWVKTSETGSRSELSFVPSENIWRNICSESDACMGMHCQYHDKCFVMKVRKQAADAKILVVNHHLLFADIETRLSGVGYEDTAVLPPYKRIIFDEAHGIESAATSFFSEDLTKFKIYKQLKALYRARKNGAMAGLLFTLVALSVSQDNSAEIIVSIEAVGQTMQELDEKALALLDMQSTIRLSAETSIVLKDTCNTFTELGSKILTCTGLFRELIEAISDDNKETQPVWEAKTILRRLEAVASFCKRFTEWDEHPDTIFFIEKNRMSSRSPVGEKFYCRFVQSPLDVSYKMNAGVFEQMRSVVCTSATLRTGRTFDFWLNRTGGKFIEEERLEKGVFSSPFPYHKNMLFAVPSDAPLPDKSDFQPYVEDALWRLVLSAAGRTLALFTSYESLKSATEAVRSRISGTGISLFKQGDDDRFRLLERFRNDSQSVLFATDSFWEGVDVPGDSLSQVIIVKLPFSVPTDPVFAARSQAIEERGGSGFMELSVPEAVIKFRQGLGRLIRHSSDRGVVVVLDRRIIEKRYGRIFIDSIPECKHVVAPLKDICDSVERFLF